MRLPSVKTIREILRCEEKIARAIRSRLEVYKSGREEARDTLLGVETIIDGHGVECIQSRQDTTREFLGVEYVNMGDAYKVTVYFDYAAGRFYVGSWGDLVEAHDHRFGE